jgi:hypothetical protein
MKKETHEQIVTLGGALFAVMMIILLSPLLFVLFIYRLRLRYKLRLAVEKRK